MLTPEQMLLRQYENWSVILHEDQSYLGRSIIVLDRGGDEEEMDPFFDTTRQEQEELTTIANGLKSALDVLYQPTRLNYGNLRNRWKRCHWHVVPRYEGVMNGLRIVDGFEFTDQNPGRNYSPSPLIEVPPEVIATIRDDMVNALHNQ